MLAPQGYDRMPLTPSWIDWNAPIEINQDLAAELDVVRWWPVGAGNPYNLADTSREEVLTHSSALLSTFGPDDRGPAAVNATAGSQYFTSGYLELAAYTAHVFCRNTTSFEYRFLFGSDGYNSKLGFDNGSLSSVFIRLVHGGTGRVTTIPSFAVGRWQQFCVSSSPASAMFHSHGQTVSLTAEASGTAVFQRYGAENNQPSLWNFIGDIADIVICQKALSPAQAYLLSTPYALAWQPSRVSMFLGSDFQYPRAPYLTGYNTRVRITIDNKHVDDDLTNFPLMVKFNNDAGIANFLDASGHNIRFTTDDGETPISYDRRSYAVTNGRASGVLFARVPTIYADRPTDIYMYLKSADPVDGEDKADVWQDYSGVWPMISASGNEADITGNGFTFLQSGTVGTRAGKIHATCRDLANSSSDYFSFADNAEFDLHATTPIEVMMVAYTEDADSTVDGWIGKGNVGTGSAEWGLKYNGSNENWYMQCGSTNSAISTHARNNWYCVTGWKDFVNDVVGLAVNNSQPVTTANTYETVGTGDIYVGRNAPPYGGAANGAIEEIRVRRSLTSTAWRHFTYYNIFESNYDLHFANIEHDSDYLEGYTQRKQLLVDYAYVDSNLTDFPLLVKITDDAGVGAAIDSNGYNIRFTAGDGLHELDYDRRSFSVVADEATGVFFVRVRDIDAFQVTRLYMYFKSADPVDGEDKAGTWQDYEGVWPLNEASGGAIDVSGNANTMTEYSTVGSAGGKIYLSRDFEESEGDHFKIDTNSYVESGDIDINFEALANMEAKKFYNLVLSKGDNYGNCEYWFMHVNSTDRFDFRYGSGTVTANNFGGASTGTWYQLYGWHDSVNNLIGVQVNATTPNTLSHSTGTTIRSGSFAISRFSDFASPSYSFDGLIEEVRIRKGGVLSTNWRNFQYHNIFESNNALFVGNLEAAPAAAAAGKPYLGGVSFVVGGYQPFSPMRRWRYTENPNDEPPTP